MTRSKEKKRLEDQKKKDKNSWRHGATSSDANIIEQKTQNNVTKNNIINK
jgi:hypothetical protein